MDNVNDYDDQYYLPNQVSSLLHGPDYNNFSLFHLNIRSFSRNCDELSVVIDQLGARPDIIVLTETWFSPGNCVDELPGYNAKHVYRTERRGGGVSVYAKRTYNSTLIPQWSFVGENLEICSVRVTVFDKQVIIHGVYRPPDKDVRAFTDDILDIINRDTRNEYVLLVGDMNIDMMRPTVPAEEFFDMCYTSSYTPLIKSPTHVTATSSTCIDHIWFNRLCEVRAGIIKTDITDHYLIFAIVPIKANVNNRFLKHFRDHSHGSVARLREEVHQFVSVFSATLDHNDIDINSALLAFTDKLYEIYDNNCPMRCKILCCSKVTKPWISNQLKDCIMRKHSLFRQYKRGTVSFQVYNTFKNVVSRILKREKSRYYSRKFDATSNDVRGTWKAINSLIGKSRNNSKLSEVVFDDEVCSNAEDIACGFNTYFTSIAGKLENEIPVCNVSPTSYMGNRTTSSFFVRPTTDKDVKSIIGGLKNKSSSLKSVPVFIYKTCASILCPVLAKLFNLSVTSGVFPSCLKCARVIPLFKSGDSKIPSNYRPISTLPVMSKIFEKLMHTQLDAFLKSNSIITSSQFGFKESCSTADAVLEYVDNVSNTLDRKMSMITVFLDFAKAFDTVKHEILIDKLDHLGVRGLPLEWFKSYLCDRRQCVDINGSRSGLLHVQSGVPQGSVLGPVLFLLYINDMNRCSNILNFVHFADDTTVFGCGENIQNLADLVNADLSRVYEWLCSNRLSLNIGKTCFMVTTDRVAMNRQPNIYINNARINAVLEAKFLGVIIDSGLTFKAHVNSVCKKLSRNIGMLNRISHLLPTEAKKNIYFSLIYSHVTYCITVWGKRSVGNSMHVGRLLRRAVKIVSHPFPLIQAIIISL